MNLPIYNTNDLLVRKAIAASGIVKKAVGLSKHSKAGSVDINEQKALEMAIAQFEIIKNYKILATSSIGIITPLGNSGIDISTTIVMNGAGGTIIASSPFIISSNNLTTATNIVNAINGLESGPNFTAVLVGEEVHIMSVDKSSTYNGYSISYNTSVPEVTYSAVSLYGGQDGVEEEDNNITETTLEALFNNIFNITGCGYAPIGTKYRTA
mgnify:CR=1 FL=1